jgi:very-short-patch-repair endonuclease
VNDLDRLTANLASRQHGTFHAAQVPGLTERHARHQVDAGRWNRHRRSVFTINGTPNTWEQRLWLKLHVDGRGSVVGFRSAARVHRLPGSRSDHLETLQPEASTPRNKATVTRRSTSLPEWHVTVVDDFPITTVERTIFDLAALTSSRRRLRGWPYVPAKRVERMLDDALVHNRMTIASLTRVFISLAGRGRAGTMLMRELIDARSDDYVPTESELEDLFLSFVEHHSLPDPRRQVSLGSSDAFIGRVEFVYDDARLVVEVDGRAFHAQMSVQRSDRLRELKLMAEGWQVVRLGWRELIDEPTSIARSLAVILDRGVRQLRAGTETSARSR